MQSHAALEEYRLGRLHAHIVAIPAESRLPKHSHANPHACVVLAGGFNERFRARQESCGHDVLRYAPAGDVHEFAPVRVPFRCLIVEAPGPHVPRADDRVYLRSPVLQSVGTRLAAELRGRDASPLRAESLALELFAGLTNHACTPDSAPRWLDRAREMLHDRVGDPPSLDDIAQVVQRHPTHVVRAWRRRFGCTMGSYARRLQLDAARHMLLRGREPLAQVALVSGFADQSHMTRAFRAMLGVTPAQLRHAAGTPTAVKPAEPWSVLSA